MVGTDAMVQSVCGLQQPVHSMNGKLLLRLQVAGMVAIFQAQKRSMKADIDQHQEILSTVQVRSWPCLQVQGFEVLKVDTVHCMLCSCWSS
jgi:hypothetical protein